MLEAVGELAESVVGFVVAVVVDRLATVPWVAKVLVKKASFRKYFDTCFGPTFVLLVLIGRLYHSLGY